MLGPRLRAHRHFERPRGKGPRSVSPLTNRTLWNYAVRVRVCSVSKIYEQCRYQATAVNSPYGHPADRSLHSRTGPEVTACEQSDSNSTPETPNPETRPFSRIPPSQTNASNANPSIIPLQRLIYHKRPYIMPTARHLPHDAPPRQPRLFTLLRIRLFPLSLPRRNLCGGQGSRRRIAPSFPEPHEVPTTSHHILVIRIKEYPPVIR